MKKFEQLVESVLAEKQEMLNEHFVNLLGDHPDKDKYKHEVWNHLQKSYEKIGGIKGSSFNNADDMKNIHMWKLATHEGRVIAGTLYKDSNGRKSVASFTDGSEHGKNKLAEMGKADLHRSLGEKSSSMLKFMVKKHGIDTMAKHAHSPEEASKLIKKPVSTSEVDPHYHQDYPELKDKFYARKIGNNTETKALFGTHKKFY